MIADGIAEGSIRPVDPGIAAQMIHAAINAVADLPQLAPGIGAQDAGRPVRPRPADWPPDRRLGGRG